jgi:hypothetical protein
LVLYLFNKKEEQITTELLALTLSLVVLIELESCHKDMLNLKANMIRMANQVGSAATATDVVSYIQIKRIIEKYRIKSSIIALRELGACFFDPHTLLNYYAVEQHSQNKLIQALDEHIGKLSKQFPEETAAIIKLASELSPNMYLDVVLGIKPQEKQKVFNIENFQQHILSYYPFKDAFNNQKGECGALDMIEYYADHTKRDQNFKDFVNFLENVVFEGEIPRIFIDNGVVWDALTTPVKRGDGEVSAVPVPPFTPMNNEEVSPSYEVINLADFGLAPPPPSLKVVDEEKEL